MSGAPGGGEGPTGLEGLHAENAELRQRLGEAEETVRAIREGTVDAFVVHESSGHRVYTLEGADRPYRLLVERMQQGALTLFADGTIAYSNLRFAAMLDLPHPQVTGASLRHFIAPAHQSLYDALLREGQTGTSQAELHVQRADGTSMPVYLTLNALPPDTGSAVGVLITDLTAQKHQERLAAAQVELREAHDRLTESEARLVSELTGMTRLHEVSTRLGRPGDRDAQLVEIVDAALAVTGADMGMIQLREQSDGPLRTVASRGLARPFLELFDAAEDPGADDPALRRGERLVIEDVAASAALAGSPALAAMLESGVRALASTAIVSRLGRLVGMLSTYYCAPRRPTGRDLRLLDLLARQAADWIERLEAERALREADRAKDEFLAMLSHELRNPLGAIGSAVRLLENVARLDATATRAHAVIDRQVAHLARLVDDLLDVGRVTAGKISLHRRPVDLAEVVTTLITVWRASGRLDRHRLTIAANPVWIEADETRLEQIISNLVGNALKFTPANGAIAIRVRVEGGEAVVEIEDTGAGISPDLLGRVFDLFVQGKRSPDRAQGGLGIGLTLVRNLVELHGGTVTARSAGLGRGSVFTVRLPAVASPPRVSAPTPPGRRGEPRRIALIEDNNDAREMMRAWLELAGHVVLEAATGRDGIAVTTAAAPDVALIDIGLPGLDGYEVARRIRAAMGRAVALIAITGYGQPEDRRRAADAGFDAYLVKPVTPEALRAALERPRGSI